TDPSGKLFFLAAGLFVLGAELYGLYSAKKALDQYDKASEIMSRPGWSKADADQYSSLIQSASGNAAVATLAMNVAPVYPRVATVWMGGRALVHGFAHAAAHGAGFGLFVWSRAVAATVGAANGVWQARVSSPDATVGDQVLGGLQGAFHGLVDPFTSLASS